MQHIVYKNLEIRNVVPTVKLSTSCVNVYFVDIETPHHWWTIHCDYNNVLRSYYRMANTDSILRCKYVLSYYFVVHHATSKVRHFVYYAFCRNIRNIKK